MKKLILILLLIILNSYMCEKNPSSYRNENSFSIHLLKDHSLTVSDIFDNDIETLDIENEPWLEAGDIDYYDFSSHCIYLKSNKNEYFTDDLDINMFDQPFVIISNNRIYSRRCYIGSFHSGAMSLAPFYPYIDELSINYYPSDVLHIARGWNSDIGDERNNMYIKQSLENANKLHEGLSLSIKEIEVIDNSDTSTVKYTYTLKNNDRDDLYVIDPSKMGTALFHYYTNGINFNGNGRSIYSKYKSVSIPEPYDSWKIDWFTKIQSGQTIERTVILKGYQKFSNGQYDCSFEFSNPYKIEKEDRYIDSGRIWIGSLVTTSEMVYIE